MFHDTTSSYYLGNYILEKTTRNGASEVDATCRIMLRLVVDPIVVSGKQRCLARMGGSVIVSIRWRQISIITRLLGFPWFLDSLCYSMRVQSIIRFRILPTIAELDESLHQDIVLEEA